MENRHFWESLNKRTELPKIPGKRRKLPLNRSLELHFDSKYDPEQGGKRENNVQSLPPKLQRSSTMIELAEEKQELNFLQRRVSQQINSVKAEIQGKIATYVKNARLSYLQTKGLKA